ncbi:MAG: hypothetical protein EXR20_09440 [Bacteroidetes bacterium]|nr:hypothetical protein [Bacteroidota bacterium]
MTTKIKHLLSATTVAVFLVLAVASLDNKQTEKEVAETEANTPAIEVSPQQLYSDWEANEVSADLKYKGKVLIVKGKVNTIGKDIMDDIYVTLNTGKTFGEVQCSFSDNHTNEAAGLKKGQTITIKGKCDGKMMNILLSGCSLQ